MRDLNGCSQRGIGQWQLRLEDGECSGEQESTCVEGRGVLMEDGRSEARND